MISLAGLRPGQDGIHDAAEGRPSRIAQDTGHHAIDPGICVQCTASRWFEKTALKWELSVDMGDTDFTKPVTQRAVL